MSDIKSYANFNTVTFEARVLNVDVLEGQYGEYAAISLISNLADDDAGVTLRFNNNAGLLTLAKQGKLQGRRVHVVGQMTGISEVYTEKATGQVKLLKRPQITLDPKTVQVTLGAMPKSDNAPVRKSNVVVTPAQAAAQAPVDKAPALAATAPAAYGAASEGVDAEDLF